MQIPHIRQDAIFLQQISDMTLSRKITPVEKRFIEHILSDITHHHTISKLNLSHSSSKGFHLDPKLLQEMVSAVKKQTQMSDEKILFEFVKVLSKEDFRALTHPLLRNYLLILYAAFHPLDAIIEDADERKALAYSALHGTTLTQKVLKNHLDAFRIEDKGAIYDLKLKLSQL